MSAAERLYTPELLALAVDLARWPRLGEAALSGDARSPTCGSTLAMDLALDGNGRIAGLGMAVRACAVGQASAAIFARHAGGRSEAEVAETLQQIEAWLTDGGPLPDWPQIELIERAREYPARHGAILLPWKAAMAAFGAATPQNR